MQYNVIVKAEMSRALPKNDAIDISTPMGMLVSEIFAQKTKIVSEGVLRSGKNGRIILSFKGEEGGEIRVSFSKKEPSLVALERGDLIGVPSVLFLEKGVRRRCIGKAPNGSKLEFTVITSALENNLLKSGRMSIDYAVEVCGVRAENSHISLNVIHDKSQEENQ